MDNLSGLDNYKTWSILQEVYDLEDEHLVDEILGLGYLNYENVSDILNTYMRTGELSDDNRNGLIGFYVLQWYYHDLELEE